MKLYEIDTNTLCIICFKERCGDEVDSDSEVEEEGGGSPRWLKFSRVLSRYLGFEHQVKDYELIQMQLNMRLQTLCDIIKQAVFVSKKRNYGELVEGQRESAESFRDEIVHKCLIKTGRRGPFLFLRKLDDSRRSVPQFSSHPQDNLLMLSLLGCVISFWLVISLSFIDPELIRKQRSSIASNEENVCFLPLPSPVNSELERHNPQTSPVTSIKDQVQFERERSLTPKIIHVESLSKSVEIETPPSIRINCENDVSNENQLLPLPTMDDPPLIPAGEVGESKSDEIQVEPPSNRIEDDTFNQNQLPPIPTMDDTPLIPVRELGEPDKGEEGLPRPENDAPSIRNRKTFLVQEVVDDVATKYLIQVTKKRKKSAEGTSQSEASERSEITSPSKRKRSPEHSPFSSEVEGKEDMSLPLVPSISDSETESETESDSGFNPHEIENSWANSSQELVNWDSDASTDVDSHVSFYPSYGPITDLSPSRLLELLRKKRSDREEMEIEPEHRPPPEFLEGLDLTRAEEIEAPAPENEDTPLVMEMVPPKPVKAPYSVYLICETCRLQFDSRAKLEKHRVVIHNCKKYVKCPICYKMFDSYQSLELHRKKQKGCDVAEHTKPLEMNDMSRPIFPWSNVKYASIFCPFEHCFEVFPSKNLLQIHLRVHAEFVCAFCPEKFHKANDLAMHESHKHLKGKNKKCAKKFACARCQFFSKVDHEYIEHFVKKHLNISSFLEESDKDNQPSSSPNKPTHLQSRQCAFSIMK